MLMLMLLFQISTKDGQDVAKEFGVRFFEVCM